MKNLATPSSIFILVFSSFTGELCSQPIRSNDHRLGRMFPEHVQRRFLDPEYSFDEYFQLGSRRKFGPIKNQLVSPNTSNWVREETFAQLRTGFTLPARGPHPSYPKHSICLQVCSRRPGVILGLLGVSIFTSSLLLPPPPPHTHTHTHTWQ